MSIPLTPARCSPLDLINPFPPFFQTAVACASLLLAATGLLLFIWRGSWQASGQRRLSYVIFPQFILFPLANLWAGGLAVWLQMQSSSFKPWCSPARGLLLPQLHALQAAQSIVPLTSNVTMAFLLAEGATIALLLRGTMKNEPVMRHQDRAA